MCQPHATNKKVHPAPGVHNNNLNIFERIYIAFFPFLPAGYRFVCLRVKLIINAFCYSTGVYDDIRITPEEKNDFLRKLSYLGGIATG